MIFFFHLTQDSRSFLGFSCVQNQGKSPSPLRFFLSSSSQRNPKKKKKAELGFFLFRPSFFFPFSNIRSKATPPSSPLQGAALPHCKPSLSSPRCSTPSLQAEPPFRAPCQDPRVFVQPLFISFSLQTEHVQQPHNLLLRSMAIRELLPTSFSCEIRASLCFGFLHAVVRARAIFVHSSLQPLSRS